MSSEDHEQRAKALRTVEALAARDAEHERAAETIRRERDDAVRAARAVGVPVKDLQAALDLSRSAVNRILGTGS